MSTLQLLIKPSSSNCNMKCSYCFYSDVASNRDQYSYGYMKLEVLKRIVSNACESKADEISFAFQGGEPTLIGLDFYRHLIEYVDQYKGKYQKIHYALQTNGLQMDKEWVEFLAKHHFLVGISLDGHKDIHDLYRLDGQGKGTYNRIMKGIQLMENAHVEYNVLSVLTAQTAKNIGKIYQFFKRNGIYYQQYIPCLDPFGEERGNNFYSLTPKLYEDALKNLFDLWYLDMQKGCYVYIRQFENWIGMLKGYAPESCGLMGRCAIQHVIEANGDVYPCDFYVLDEFKIGNVMDHSFQEIDELAVHVGFVEPSLQEAEKCKTCRWRPLCRGGCRRDRDMGNDVLGLNYYCQAYENFFAYSIERMEELASRIK